MAQTRPSPLFQAIDHKTAVVIDLGGVPYLSSAGIRLFVALQKNLQVPRRQARPG